MRATYYHSFLGFRMKLEVGDKIKTKKPHPCGSDIFTITRKGADFRLLCNGCGKNIWITREKLEKRIKKIERNGEVVE